MAAALIDELAGQPERGRVFVQTVGVYNPALLTKVGMMNGIFAVPDYEPSMPAVYRTYFGVPEAVPWHGKLYAVASAGPRAHAKILCGGRGRPHGRAGGGVEPKRLPRHLSEGVGGVRGERPERCGAKTPPPFAAVGV